MNVALHNEEKSPTIPGRINKLLSLPVGITPPTRKFLLTLEDQFNRTHGLTKTQFEAFQKIETANSPDAIKKALEWNKNMTTEMKNDLRIVSQFYIANTPNFHSIANLILQDETFIVTEDIYKKMVLNKYAQKVLQSTKAKPKFKEGDAVIVFYHSDIVKRGKIKTPPKDKTIAMVVKPNHEPVSSAVKGGKKYLVLGYGKVGPLVVEERHIKAIKE